jgi:hypothetical protein
MCQGCARFNLEVNCATLELESATETAKNLKEELESENIEGRNTKSAIPNNDYTSDERNQIQSQTQKNYNREIMNMTNDNLNGNNMILMRVGSSVEVVNITKEAVKQTNSTKSQSNLIDRNKKKENAAITKKAEVVNIQIPVSINGRIVTKNGENAISLTGMVVTVV